LKGPFLTAAALALLGLWMLGREVRRFLRDDTRYASNPTEARRSSVAAAAIALVLLTLAGGVIGLGAGVSRYRPFDAPDPPALTVTVANDGGSYRIALVEHEPGSGSSTLAVVEPGWFSIVADEVLWHAPFRWAGFPSSMRPRAVLWARARSDLAHADRIRRIEFSSDALFERFLRGPASTPGLWSLAEIRTPWRPVRTGSSEYLFSEKGTAVVRAGG
jgi:hypothetical protein